MTLKADICFCEHRGFWFEAKTPTYRKKEKAKRMKDIAIREHHLYNKAYKKGKSYVGRTVVVYVLCDYGAERIMRANPQKKYVNRLGLSVSKKLGGAVVRNRVKRILRAAYDTVKAELKTGNLIVLSARGAAVKKKSGDIARELRYAFRTLDMMADKTTEKSDIPQKED